MRQLATLPTATAAQSLADYLLTLKIQTRLMEEPDGWAVWVCDEDRLPQAREEFAEFQRNPDDPRFRAAAREADEVRRQQRRAESDYQRRDSRFRRRMYNQQMRPVTATLIAVCIALFVVLAPRGAAAWTLSQWLLIAPFTLAQDKISWDGLEQITSGQVWRLVTPIFLHFGIWHLLFNMLMLYRLGSDIEMRRGSWLLLLLVLVLGVESNLMQYYFGHLSWVGRQIVAHPYPDFGGMSGVIYGLFGYVLTKAYMEPDRGFFLAPSTVLWLLMWFALCFVPEFQEMIGGRIANMAHAAGLMGGLLIGVAGYAWRRVRGR
jgi:GlpG protein